MDALTTEHQLRLLSVDARIRRNLFGGVLALGAATYATYALLRPYYPDAAAVLAVAVLLIGFGWGVWAYTKAVLVPSLVSVGPTRLAVRDLRRDFLVLDVLYADIAAYRYQDFNGTQELRLTLRTGERRYVKASTNLGNAADFVRMVRQFEQQLAALPAPGSAAEPKLITREKGFFEKPISTVLLVPFTLLMAAATWWVAVGELSLQPNFFVAGGVYLSYLAAWLVGGRQRR